MPDEHQDAPIIKLGIAEDHLKFLQFLTDHFNSLPGFRVTIAAPSGEILLERLEKIKDDLRPDILLMDLDMPGISGAEATTQVTKLYPSIKTVSHTSHTEDWNVLKMFNAGACAYYPKNIKTSLLENALADVYQKDKYHSPIYNLKSHTLREHDQAPEISFTEKELLFLQLHADGYTNRQMAEKGGFRISEVMDYKELLFDKLNVEEEIAMALEARRRGLTKFAWEKKAASI